MTDIPDKELITEPTTSLDNSAPLQSDLQQTQISIGQTLEQLSQSHDTEKLCKQWLVSRVQLLALFNGDSQRFHSYGIYLRTLKKALNTLDPNNTDYRQALARLEKHYHATSRGSEIQRLKQTINKSIPTAELADSECNQPIFSRDSISSKRRISAALVMLVLIALIFLVMFLPFS